MARVKLRVLHNDRNVGIDYDREAAAPPASAMSRARRRSGIPRRNMLSATVLPL
jgi:hypothetical protein